MRQMFNVPLAPARLKLHLILALLMIPEEERKQVRQPPRCSQAPISSMVYYLYILTWGYMYGLKWYLQPKLSDSQQSKVHIGASPSQPLWLQRCALGCWWPSIPKDSTVVLVWRKSPWFILSVAIWVEDRYTFIHVHIHRYMHTYICMYICIKKK